MPTSLLSTVLCRMGTNSVITRSEGSNNKELTLKTDCVDCSADGCSDVEKTFVFVA